MLQTRPCLEISLGTEKISLHTFHSASLRKLQLSKVCIYLLLRSPQTMYYITVNSVGSFVATTLWRVTRQETYPKMKPVHPRLSVRLGSWNAGHSRDSTNSTLLFYAQFISKEPHNRKAKTQYRAHKPCVCLAAASLCKCKRAHYCLPRLFAVKSGGISQQLAVSPPLVTGDKTAKIIAVPLHFLRESVQSFIHPWMYSCCCCCCCSALLVFFNILDVTVRMTNQLVPEVEWILSGTSNIWLNRRWFYAGRGGNCMVRISRSLGGTISLGCCEGRGHIEQENVIWGKLIYRFTISDGCSCRPLFISLCELNLTSDPWGTSLKQFQSWVSAVKLAAEASVPLPRACEGGPREAPSEAGKIPNLALHPLEFVLNYSLINGGYTSASWPQNRVKKKSQFQDCRSMTSITARTLK